MASQLYNTEISMTLEYGDLEDVPATFDFDPVWQPAEPDVGIFTGYFHAPDCEFTSLMIGMLKFDRSQMVEMAGKTEVLRIEGVINAKIEADLSSGELEVS